MVNDANRRPRPAKQGATKKAGAAPATPSTNIAPRLFKAKIAADYLGISPRTLWTLTNLGEIGSVRFSTGGRETVRYDVSDLDSFIEGAKA